MRQWTNLPRTLKLVTFLGIVLLAGLCAGCTDGGNNLTFPTEYQAVFLDNGQVFFGKLGDSGGRFLTLREVYYVQRLARDQAKEGRNLLVKRGHEWHAPEFMRINRRHVVLIEPVARDSRVARLIREAREHPAAAAAPAPAPALPPPAQTSKPQPAGQGGGRPKTAK